MHRAEETENTAHRQEGKVKVEKQEKHPWEVSVGAAGSEVSTRHMSWGVWQEPGGSSMRPELRDGHTDENKD